MAFFSPAWSSDITSLTPPRPRVFRQRRNSVQKHLILGVSHVEAEYLAAPSDLFVQPGAGAGDLGLGDAGIRTECF